LSARRGWSFAGQKGSSRAVEDDESSIGKYALQFFAAVHEKSGLRFSSFVLSCLK
jgi:hypothetical protein